jgi:hypothetical protein
VERNELKLCEEVLARFPEIRVASEGHGDNPTVLLHEVVHWLSKAQVSSSVESRVIAFMEWSQSQPRGTAAHDDIATMVTTSFYEGLFDHEHTRTLIPRLVSKKDFVEGAEYLQQWVGEENYQKALALFDGPRGPNKSLERTREG